LLRRGEAAELIGDREKRVTEASFRDGGVGYVRGQHGEPAATPGNHGGEQMGIGVGLFLLAVGAILTFAIHVSTGSSGVDLNTIGVILMIVGGLGIILS